MGAIRDLIIAAKWPLVGVAGLSVLSSGLSVALLSYLNEAMARVGADLDGFLSAFAALTVLSFIAATAARAALHTVGHRLVYQLRRRLVERLLATDIEQLEAHGTGRIIAMMNADTRSLTLAFVHLPELIFGATLLVAALVYLGVLSLPLFVVTALWIAAMAAIGWSVIGRINHHISRLREREDSLHNDYLAVISGRKELALNRHRAVRYYDEVFDRNADAYRSHVTRADIYNGILQNAANALVLGLIGVVFYLALALGWAPLSVAATYAVTILFLRAPLVGALAGTSALSAAWVSLKTIDSLALAPADAALGGATTNPAECNQIALREVTYRYPERNGERGFGVGPLSLTLARGEIAFVIGGNGSGKSTLAKLVTGLYRPHSGRLEVDGTPVTETDLASYRHRFSAVFSDFHLFQRLVTGTGDELPAAEVDNWLRYIAMQDKASHAQGELQSTDFSQGQRKRLALMLSLLEGRDFLLLDEWAAEQDPEFRHFFYRTVLPALRAQGTGILAMTHDERYFDVADRVLRLEDGQLSEVTADSGIARATALAGLVRGAQQPSVKRSPKSGQGQK